MSMIKATQIRKLTREVATSPGRGIFEHITNMWWTYDPKDDALIFFKLNSRTHGTPQCNSHEAIARHIVESAWVKSGFDFKVIFMPSVFVPMDHKGNYRL